MQEGYGVFPRKVGSPQQDEGYLYESKTWSIASPQREDRRDSVRGIEVRRKEQQPAVGQARTLYISDMSSQQSNSPVPECPQQQYIQQQPQTIKPRQISKPFIIDPSKNVMLQISITQYPRIHPALICRHFP